MAIKYKNKINLIRSSICSVIIFLGCYGISFAGISSGGKGGGFPNPANTSLNMGTYGITTSSGVTIIGNGGITWPDGSRSTSTVTGGAASITLSGDVTGTGDATVIDDLSLDKLADGTLPDGVIASSIAVNAVYPNAIRSGVLPSSVIASSIAVNSVYSNSIRAGLLPSNVIVSSVAIGSITDSAIVNISASKVNTGSLGASVIASSIAVNGVYAQSIGATGSGSYLKNTGGTLTWDNPEGSGIGDMLEATHGVAIAESTTTLNNVKANLSGATFTGTITAPNVAVTYGVSGATAVFSGSVTADSLNLSQGTLPGELALMEGSGSGTNMIVLKSSPTLSSDFSFTLPSSTGTSGQVLTTNGNGDMYWNTPSASSAGTAVEQTITQTGHSFSTGDVLRVNSSSVYVKAQADTAENSEVSGIVGTVIDENSFKLVNSGLITGLTDLTTGQAYFLSDSVAGALTVTEPTNESSISKPVLIAVSATSGYFTNFRGISLASLTGGSVEASAITAGTMDADVICSSAGINIIGPDQMQNGKNYNLSTSSMTLSQLTLAGGGTATGITGDIPEISTVTYARINTIQFNDGTIINSSSTLGGTTESIAASAITAGTLGADVIASSIAVASVQNEMITAVGADKINAGTLGASVIASSVAVNAVRAESIKDISLDATYLVLGGTTTAGTNAVRISKFFPSAITISTITVTCVGGTGGAFNIEERTVPATAGTDVWSSDVTVSTTAWCGGAMGNSGIAANAALYLVPTSWNGAVLAVEIKGSGTRD